MKLAQIAVMMEDGTMVWDGSLKTFLRANNDYPSEFEHIDRRALIADLRAGMTQPHGRPEPAILGGGAAPLVYVSLVA